MDLNPHSPVCKPIVPSLLASKPLYICSTSAAASLTGVSMSFNEEAARIFSLISLSCGIQSAKFPAQVLTSAPWLIMFCEASVELAA